MVNDRPDSGNNKGDSDSGYSADSYHGYSVGSVYPSVGDPVDIFCAPVGGFGNPSSGVGAVTGVGSDAADADADADGTTAAGVYMEKDGEKIVLDKEALDLLAKLDVSPPAEYAERSLGWGSRDYQDVVRKFILEQLYNKIVRIGRMWMYIRWYLKNSLLVKSGMSLCI